VSKQELYLIQFAASQVTEPRASTSPMPHAA
jgi:hypothetical protein